MREVMRRKLGLVENAARDLEPAFALASSVRSPALFATTPVRALAGLVKRGATVAPSTLLTASAKMPAQISPMPDMAYSIAPMMEVTDRHFRSLARLISRRAVLYTEMVVDKTLIHNERIRQYELRIPELPTEPLRQHPVVLQLGGSVPEELEAAARIASTYGYTEVNLNCGCPSPKVAGKGCFGAALMRTPEIVAEATKRMKEVLPPSVPVTVKCRIGVDDDDSYASLHKFISVVSKEGGVRHFIVHARNAILGGLSPAQNRSIPPLKYHYVYRLLEDFPELKFTINGGLKTTGQVGEQLGKGVHGVMVGRAVMDKPWHALCDVDYEVYGEALRDPDGQFMSRRKVLQSYAEYADAERKAMGSSVRALVKPLLNLFHGEKNGKRFRRVIDQCLQKDALSVRDIIAMASAEIPSDVLDAPPPSLALAMDYTLRDGVGIACSDEEPHLPAEPVLSEVTS